MPTHITVLGSTGSIGRNALEVIDALGPDYRAAALSAHRRCDDLLRQIQQHHPHAVAVSDAQRGEALRPSLNGTELLLGPEGLVDLVRRPDCDFVIAAIVGAAGLPATLEAVKLGKSVGIANKETLVVAGGLIMATAKASGAALIPIDSEHSAIFQCIRAGDQKEISKIYLTTSGGPFRTWSPDQIAAATLDDAMNHPTWDMGPKITIDSATMMNKALEIIEAKWLFGVDPDQIEVIVHPESIIHSMVEFCDGSLIAQLGSPDMRTPIQYALTHPRRAPASGNRLDVRSLRRMNFEPPDLDRFPALRLGHEVARKGGSSGAVLNAANEAAVEAFRQYKISFTEIVKITENVLKRHEWIAEPTLDELTAADQWARQEVKACLTS
jgi:1-deoxy-D-xylulose-5-phosphate reductoisomerase